MHSVLFDLFGVNRLKRPEANIERQLADFDAAIANPLENLGREV